MTPWRFNRLTPEQKLLARQLYEQQETDFTAMIKLMNLYSENRVSPDQLIPCCGGALKNTLDWTKWAIQKGEL